jgi:uncharacterized membrane protein
MFTGADWLVVIGAFFAGIAGVIGAVWRQRDRGLAGAAVQPRHGVALSDDDRSLLRQLVDVIDGHRKSIDGHAEMIGRHRHAIGDDTAERRRQRPE